jgi:hypothetical protein
VCPRATRKVRCVPASPPVQTAPLQHTCLSTDVRVLSTFSIRMRQTFILHARTAHLMQNGRSCFLVPSRLIFSVSYGQLQGDYVCDL